MHRSYVGMIFKKWLLIYNILLECLLCSPSVSKFMKSTFNSCIRIRNMYYQFKALCQQAIYKKCVTKFHLFIHVS